LIAAGLVAVLAGGVSAQETQPVAEAVDLPDGKAIVTKAVDAMGGREAFEAVKTLETHATVEMPTGMTLDLKFYSSATGAFLIKQQTPMGEVALGSNGEVGWMRNPMSGQYSLMDDATRRESLRQATMHQMFSGAEDRWETIETVAKDTFGEKDAYKVRFADDDVEMFGFFDSENGMPLGMERQQGPGVVRLAFEEWDDFGDIKLFKVMRVEQMGMEMAMVYETIKINETESAVFDLPDEVKELATAEPASQPDKDGAKEEADGG
jgi:hypothetical protein